MRRLSPFLLLSSIALTGCPEDSIVSDDDVTSDDDDTVQVDDDDTTPSSDDDDDDSTPNPNDLDGDGWTPADGDCHDADPDIHPGAEDTPCDQLDSDCDGVGGDVAAVLNDTELPTIAEAIASSVNGDTVYICPGTHTEQVLLPDNLELTVTSWSGTYADTVLDGQDALTVLYVGEGSRVDISHLHLTNGQAQGWIGGQEAGGGIMALAADELTVTECLFTDNYSASIGAGITIYADTGQLVTAVIDGCTFETNEAGSSGGSVNLTGWGDLAVTIVDSTFTGNTSGTGGGAVAGGTWGSIDLDIEDSDFGSSTSDSSGGAITVNTNEESWLSLVRCSFEGNHAGVDGGGGAIVAGNRLHASPLYMDVSDSSFMGNSAGSSGGACQLGGYGELFLTMDSTSFVGNQADHSASAIKVVEACELYATITGTTFESNVSGGSGSGAFDVAASHSETAISDCVFRNNEGPAGAAMFIGGGAAQVAHATLTDTVVEDNVANNAAVYVSGAASVEITGGSILRNVGGGSFLSWDSGSLVSAGVDWGTAADDNDPFDVSIQDGSEYSSYGSGASFACTPDAGCI